MRIVHRPLVAAVCAALLFVACGYAQATPQAEAGQPATELSKALYWQGHDALGKGDMDAALTRFRDLEARLRKAKETGVDSAIYWQAYVLVQSKRQGEADTALARLAKEFPQSRWTEEAQALRSPQARSARRENGDDDRDHGKSGDDGKSEGDRDALMAIDTLLTTGNKRAVPVLQRVLAGTRSDKVKARALFVLSQIDQDAADAALSTILSGPSTPSLKREAIRMIAAGGNKSSLDRLEALYRESSDTGIRRAVIEAWLIGSRSDLLAKVASTETDKKLRNHAINTLGAAGDRKRLNELYGALHDADGKRAVLNALGVAGDAEALERIGLAEPDGELRIAAIRAIGIAGHRGGGDALLRIYRSAHTVEVKRSVVQGLIVAGYGKGIATLYGEETDKDLKRELLRALTVTDGDTAIDIIDQSLR